MLLIIFLGYQLFIQNDDRFMDAEIGIRNLADSFRYNVLPDIIEALGLAKDKLGSGVDSFEDLPEFERLQILVSHSRDSFGIQAETTIKVTCSI